MNSTNSADIPSSNSGTTQEDRRHHERYTVQVQIEIHGEGSGTPLRLATTDISRGGCYVRVVDQFALGLRVRATLWLDGYPVMVEGLVVTRHPQFGNGIMFMKFENDGERLLGRYVDAIAALA